MKKLIPYLLIMAITAALGFLLLGDRGDRIKRLDERLTFKKSDKIPYGTFVSWKLLPEMFPQAVVYPERSGPGYWDSLVESESSQALIIVVPEFQADEYEMQSLIDFASSGNDVLISCRRSSIDIQNMLKLRTSFSFTPFEESDTLELKLKNPPFREPLVYNYPGKKFDNYLVRHNETISRVLGTSFDNEPNLVHLKTGKGNLYFHLAPLAFSNYFLLYGNNIGYYEKLLSLISHDVKRVAWDEYFLGVMYRQPKKSRNSWLGIMLKYPALKWGLLTALFTMLLFVLLEMRRRQRQIPVYEKQQNDWLDFVKTIGRLYHDRGDHLNLCRKMSSYFLEHVRTNYKMTTGRLDEAFIRNLQIKSGYNEAGINHIVQFILFTETASAVSEKQLIFFYKQLELFYKHT